MHRTDTLDNARTLNLLGAFALNITDTLNNVFESTAGFGGETSAAIVTLGSQPGLSINALRQILNLSQPGTVRLVDRLARENLVERRSGTDGRTLAVFLTRSGMKRRTTILSERRQQLQHATNTLSNDEQRLLTLLLEKMLDGLTKSENQAAIMCRLCEEESCPLARCPVEQACKRVQP